MEIIKDFVLLVEQKPELFSREDRKDLEQQNWSDDPETLGNEIWGWVSVREEVYQALRDISSQEEQDLLKRNKLPGGVPTAPKIDPKDYKGMLLNAIHRINNPSPSQATPQK